jgi:hypothetical protein
VQLRGYVGWRDTGSVTQRDDCCAELSVQFGAFSHVKGYLSQMKLLSGPERWDESKGLRLEG